MTTALQFRNVQDANSILRNGKAKAQWKALSLSDMPRDLQQLALDWFEADQSAAAAKAALIEQLNDKAEAIPGKRLIAALPRGATPETFNAILWDRVDGATTSKTPVVSFAQFLKG